MMQKKLFTIAALVLCLCIASGSTAQESNQETDKPKVQKKKGKAGNKKQIDKIAKRISKSLAGVELTKEQKEKLTKLVGENVDALQSLQKKINGIIDKDKRKTMNAAVKKARGAGKNREEASKAGYEAIGLSEDQQKEVKKSNTERTALMDKIKEQIIASFSEEQKKAFGASKGKKQKGDKTKKKKKKDAAEDTGSDSADK